VGNASWSSVTTAGKFYHVGTIPNKKSNTYVSDLRMMVTGKHHDKLYDKILIFFKQAVRKVSAPSVYMAVKQDFHSLGI
jgi:hypothetical protein